jgi:CubicO group peptidase (beta-lactamase class C family)
MAKIGLLYLLNGLWDEVEIVPEEWISEATTSRISTEYIKNCHGYGYHWWLKTWQVNSTSYETYFAFGGGGHEITIIPDLELVVVFTCADFENHPDNNPPEDIVPTYILSALLD